MQAEERASFSDLVAPHLISSVVNTRKIFDDGCFVLVMKLEFKRIMTAIADPDIRPGGIQEDVELMGRMLSPGINLVTYFRFIQDGTNQIYDRLHSCTFDHTGAVLRIPSCTLAAELETKRGGQDEESDTRRAPPALRAVGAKIPGQTNEDDEGETDHAARGDTGGT